MDGTAPSPGSEAVVPEVRRKRKYTKRNAKSGLQAPPSPSPPSTDTEEDEESSDNNGEDSKLSRICQLAAKASSRLKKIEKQSSKVKTKEGGAKRGRVVKMEVETVSTNISIDPHPQPQTTATTFSAPSNPAVPQTQLNQMELATIPEPSVIDQAESIIQEAVLPPSPGNNSKIVSARDIKVKDKEPVALKASANAKSIENNTPPSSPPVKASFKIPKKTNGENGQVSFHHHLCHTTRVSKDS